MLKWFHDFVNEPCIIYSEIDTQRYEVRKVEVYKNETVRKYGENISDSQMELGDAAFSQNLDEINRDRQFYAKYITKEEFESIWNK